MSDLHVHPCTSWRFHAGLWTFVSHSGATSLTPDLVSNLTTYISASNLCVCNPGLVSNHRTLMSTSRTFNLVHHLGLLTTRTITSFCGLPYLTPHRAPVTLGPASAF